MNDFYIFAYQNAKLAGFIINQLTYRLKKIDNKLHSMQKEMRFAIFGNTYQEHKSAHVAHLLSILRKKNANICISHEFYEFLRIHTQTDLSGLEIFDGNNFTADMALSIGGDGTFLKAASRVGEKGIPILGINTGRLGFLAAISPDEMEETFDEIYQGKFIAEPRRVLKLTCENNILKGNPYALNEVAVLKRDSSSMITIKAYVNNELLNIYQADGLIVATPTGSTGYSLSVGGPIMVPQSGTLCITPVAPHSLNVRPIVLRDDWEIKLEVGSRSHNFLISLDGRSESCHEEAILIIKRASHFIKIVKRYNHTFFNTLREKMMWGADSRI